MHNNRLPISRNTRTPRPNQTLRSRNKKRQLALHKRPHRTLRSRITDVVQIRRPAVTREEENVRSVLCADHIWGFDKGSVELGIGQESFWSANGARSVGGDFLDHDGRGLDRRDGVSAVAAVAQGVGVDFVEGVVLAVRWVLEVRCVQSSALVRRTSERDVAVGQVGSFNGFARCCAYTVEEAVAGRRGDGGVVHEKTSVIAPRDGGSPNERIGCSSPWCEFSESVFAGESPGPQVF